uniref:Uncharacterized protein n=1 Tax=Lactuca sativa TaxID=4236 RepID=A0A9R1VUJ1_LACSA|nr:hypothetical protein LSAT_V11C400162310 [Lactuca sativa]
MERLDHQFNECPLSSTASLTDGGSLAERISGSYNYDLPKSLETSFSNEDDVPWLDHGNHTSLPPPPPLFSLTYKFLKSSRSLNPYWQAMSTCAHILEMKSHIDKLGKLGVEVSKKLAIDWVLQSLPDDKSRHEPY